jgi:hypothetical protein
MIGTITRLTHVHRHILETEPLPDQVAQLAQEMYNNDVLQLMAQNIWRFEFEVRVWVSQVVADAAVVMLTC